MIDKYNKKISKESIQIPFKRSFPHAKGNWPSHLFIKGNIYFSIFIFLNNIY